MARNGDIRPDIAIIGTDPAGMEIAMSTAALGVPVTLVVPDEFEPGDTGAALQRLRALGVRVISGPCRFLDPRRLQVGDLIVRPRRFVLATPPRIVPPDIAGLADLDTPEIRPGSAFLAIGQGRRAVEAACKARQAGAEVTLLTQGALLSDFDSESVRLVRINLARAGIAVVDAPLLEGGAVIPASPSGRGPQRRHKLVSRDEAAFAFDRMFVEGRSETFPDEIEPGEAGILGRDNRLIVDKALTTTNRHVLAVGAACGDADAAVNRAAQVSTALGSLLFRRASRHYPALAVRYAPSIPAIAECGLREDDLGKNDLGKGARGRHRFYRVRLPDEGISGSIKVITNAKGKLLGVSIVAARPLDLLPVFQLAMAQGLGIADLAGLPLPSASHAAAIGDLARLGLREKLFAPSTGRLIRLLRVLG